MSDAVDATVAKIDFSPLQGKSVYLDSTYIKTYKSPLLIDSDYVISSLRQQMVGAGVHLTDLRDEAELIAEARLGALGLDGHNVTYGIPASNAISSASTVFTSTPILPSFPEISLARREAKAGAAKIAVFAYERDTRQPVWQSGIARSSSSARDTWVLGAGPWQSGTIYEGGARFAGRELPATNIIESKKSRDELEEEFRLSETFEDYTNRRLFKSDAQWLVPEEFQVEMASATKNAEGDEESAEESK